MIVFCFLATVPLPAATGGSISGMVLDPSGAVIPGAALRVVNTGQQTIYRVISDSQGFYSFPNLPVGHYELTISATGFTTQRKTNLTVDTDSALRVDATLAVGGQSDSCDRHQRHRSAGRDRRNSPRRGRIERTDDRAPVEWKELHGPAGDPTGSGPYLDPVAKLRHHGGRYRKPRPVG